MVAQERDAEVIAEAICEDGHNYIMRPLAWDLETVRRLWNDTPIEKTFSDEFTKTEAGFLNYVLMGASIWFEIVNTDTGESVGLMYLTDFVQGKERFQSAMWHASIWDAQATKRAAILKAGIAGLFKRFRFHRMHSEVPCHFAGTIKVAKKLGFTVEGRVRESRAYNGVWYDSLVLGLLEHEVALWEL